MTSHLGSATAHVWSFENKRMGSHALKGPDGKAVVQTTAVSGCGNFAFLGTAEGHVYRFNIQSGLFRQAYGKPKG